MRPLLQELCNRLMAHFAAAEGKSTAAKGGMAKDISDNTHAKPFAISFEDTLPLQVTIQQCLHTSM
jgi:hypothetical protein